MTSKSVITIAIITIVLCGCASTAHQNTSEVFSGRVVKVENVPAIPRSSGAYQPGMAGALGGLVAGLITNFGGTPAYNLYTLKASDGAIREFPAKEKFEIGNCLAVFTPPTRTKDSFQTLEEVTLNPMNRCNLE